MITPSLIQILFWLATLSCIFLGLTNIINDADYFYGLQILILGPLALRVIAEMVLLLFRIYDRLGLLVQQQQQHTAKYNHDR